MINCCFISATKKSTLKHLPSGRPTTPWAIEIKRQFCIRVGGRMKIAFSRFSILSFYSDINVFVYIFFCRLWLKMHIYLFITVYLLFWWRSRDIFYTLVFIEQNKQNISIANLLHYKECRYYTMDDLLRILNYNKPNIFDRYCE